MADPIYAFFDEYGEEGFSGKASEWFVLSAALQGAEDIENVRTCYADFKKRCHRDKGWHFHFIKSDHRARLAFVEAMRPAGYVFMSIAVHKPSITVTENFKRPYFLYFYAAKLLLERISWLCRKQDRRVDYAFFSSRRGLRSMKVRLYLARLRERGADLENSIYWPALDEMGIRVEQNKARVGLQLADLMASSIGHAIEPRHGITEPRYVLELKEHIYRYNGSRLGYGLKVFPRLTAEMRSEPRFAWLEQFGR
jgi:hypothetical protein